MGLKDMAKGNHILCFSKVLVFIYKLRQLSKKSNGTFGLKYEYLDLDISPDPLNPGYQNKKPCLVSILGSKMQVKQILL